MKLLATSRLWLVIPLCSGILLNSVATSAPLDPCASATITQAAYVSKPVELQHYSQACIGYAKSYAILRLAQLQFGRVPMQDNLQLVDRGIANLEQSTLHGEDKVLLAALYNLKMGLEPTHAQQLLPEFQDLLAQALQDPASRPRALLIQGIHWFHVPLEFGGGSAASEAALQQALSAFAQQKTSPQQWGEAEAQLWLGQVQAARGDQAGASKSYKQALQLAPNYAFAHHLLRELAAD